MSINPNGALTILKGFGEILMVNAAARGRRRADRPVMHHHQTFDSAQDYRRRAAQCFRFSRGAVSFEVARALARMAAEYEVLAERVEHGETPPQRTERA